jgi:hypothetical protein
MRIHFTQFHPDYRAWYVQTPVTQDPFTMGWQDMDDEWSMYMMGGEL